MKEPNKLLFSILMPTYNQASFIRRAIKSLLAQTYPYWELIIINDGSTDNTTYFIDDFLKDSRITYIENNLNFGLGYSLNEGLKYARYDYIAYLPSDDYFDEDHLKNFYDVFIQSSDIVLSFSGIRFDESKDAGILAYRNCKGIIPGYSAQLVQVAHKKTSDRWVERSQLISEDLFVSFFQKLTKHGFFVPTNKVSCEWTNHPYQRHKICGERFGGGITIYKYFYKTKIPLCFRCTPFKTIDEKTMYVRSFINLHSKDHLKILIVGELAYNPDRICALEEAGCKLYGLWAKPRYCYSTIGPLPFGNIIDIPYDKWEENVMKIKPDIIYGLLSTSAIDLAYEVLLKKLNIPFVWHFKEGPHEAMKLGLWDKLINLYTFADGIVFINRESEKWFHLFLPPREREVPTLILDGDLPKKEYFNRNYSEKLSSKDGSIHTVVTGRIIGLSPNEFSFLAKNNIHIHIYSENQVSEEDNLMPYKVAAGNYFHIHNHIQPSRWVEEFSQYDAGWLHCIQSSNHGSIFKATWSDLNLPARLTTLIAASVPMIQKRNKYQLYAQKNFVEKYNMGILYDDIEELCSSLSDKKLLHNIETNIRTYQNNFTFDKNVFLLIDFFKTVINKHKL